MFVFVFFKGRQLQIFISIQFWLCRISVNQIFIKCFNVKNIELLVTCAVDINCLCLLMLCYFKAIKKCTCGNLWGEGQ